MVHWTKFVQLDHQIMTLKPVLRVQRIRISFKIFAKQENKKYVICDSNDENQNNSNFSFIPFKNLLVKLKVFEIQFGYAWIIRL